MNLHFSKRKLSRAFRLLTASIIFGLASQAQAVCYVNATGTGDGSSWANAAPFLQPILANRTCAEIWVAKGVYKPVLPAANPSNSFDIQPGTAVYGGFAGGEKDRNSRDPVKNATILSGDIDNNDFLTDGYTSDAEDIAGTNSYHVVRFDGTTALGAIGTDTLLDGFTVTAGAATDADVESIDSTGGGILCIAGGLGHECQPTLQKLQVVGNTATGILGGGGISFVGDDSGATNVSMSNSVIAGNAASFGGGFGIGFYTGTWNASLQGLTFKNNRASLDGGALAFGSNDKGSPTIRECLFENNSAEGTGGAILSGATDGSTGNPRIDSSTFIDNIANEGGAIGFVDVRANLNPVLMNDTFAYNEARRLGGAVANDAYGDVSTTNLHPQFFNVTFQGNSAPRGGLMYSVGSFDPDEIPDTVHPEFTNSVLWNDYATDSGNEIVHEGGTTIISYSVVEGGCPSFGICDHVVDEDPKLGILRNNGGFAPTYLPASDSVVVDAGTNATCPAVDQRGYSRSDGRCDIGATEVGAAGDEIFKDGFE